MRGCEHTRRLDASRPLPRTALAAFGSLFLGTRCTATAAWASDGTAEATGLAAVTDPLAAKASDTSRLAARPVPRNQQGHRAPTDEGTSPRLVSGLNEPADPTMEERAETVRAVLRADERADLSNSESVGDNAAEVVTPLPGIPVRETASDLTALQHDIDATEAAVLPGTPDDRSVVVHERAAAPEGAQPTDTDDARGHAPNADAAQPWTEPGSTLPDLKTIPGGAAGSTTGNSVDSGHAAVDVSSSTGGEQVSFARAVGRGLGRPMDRAAELSVAPD